MHKTKQNVASNSKKRKNLSKISDFSSARLGSGTDGAILLIAKPAKLEETKDVFKHVKTKFTNVLPKDLSQFRKKKYTEDVLKQIR